MSYWTEQLRGV